MLIGTVYLLYFDRPYWVTDAALRGVHPQPAQRLQAHREGDGGVTTRRAFDQGIGFMLAGSRSLVRGRPPWPFRTKAERAGRQRRGSRGRIEAAGSGACSLSAPRDSSGRAGLCALTSTTATPGQEPSERNSASHHTADSCAGQRGTDHLSRPLIDERSLGSATRGRLTPGHVPALAR
jgi:hypothetical protein